MHKWEELLQSSEKYMNVMENVFELADDGLLLADAEGTCLKINPAFSQTLDQLEEDGVLDGESKVMIRAESRDPSRAEGMRDHLEGIASERRQSGGPGAEGPAEKAPIEEVLAEEAPAEAGPSGEPAKEGPKGGIPEGTGPEAGTPAEGSPAESTWAEGAPGGF